MPHAPRRMRALPFVGAALLASLPPVPVASAPARPPQHRPAPSVLGTYVRGPDHLVAGSPAALRVATHWASSEQQSGPLGGVEIALTLAGGGRSASLYRGRTDGAGLADARFQVPAWPDGRYVIAVVARDGGREEIQKHEVEIQPSAKVLLESDKPLYQPAQLIHLRAIAARPQDGRPLAGRKLTFEVEDPRGNKVFREAAVTSEFGVAAADFQLADEILLGAYRARVTDGEGGRAGELDLRVERYALPKFKIGVAPDRPFYAPGDRVQLTVDGQYFFGKPVAGGAAKVSVRSGDAVRVMEPVLRGRLDGDGQVRLAFDLAPNLPEGRDEAPLQLAVEVTDAAGHVEHADRELTVTTVPLRIEVTAEAGVLLPGVENRLWVTATRPDGTPGIGAEIALGVDGGAEQIARTDAIGVAELRYLPPRGARRLPTIVGCGRGQAALRVRVPGLAAPLSRCLTVAAEGGLLLRTDRALYPAGAPIEADLLTDGADGTAWLDVVKDGQTVDTAAVVITGGRGLVVLPADERRFGTLALRAYRIAPDGKQTHDARLVYVERPSAIRVEARTEGSASGTFRPGESGRIRLRVVDAASGAPARASVGVVMIDQALLALRAVRPGAARTFFSLAAEATRPGLAMKSRPGGYTVERLIEEGALDGLKQEAARILLAGAAPPWALGFEIDPWAQRRKAKEDQVARVTTALERFARDHSLGERAPGTRTRWRYRSDLVVAMIAAQAIPARDARDPWGRTVGTSDVVAAAGLGAFDEWAAGQVDARLTAIYRAVSAERARLAQEQGPRRRREVRITAADLEGLVARKRLSAGQLVDPWGSPFRVEERKVAVRMAGLWSRFVIASAGPDGQVATVDDRFPVDESWGRGRDQITIRGGLSGDAFGRGGLGIRGVGYGGGGVGYGSIGMGSIGTIGRGSGSGYGRGSGAAWGDESPARVRSSFPETMLWRPEVITDAAGEAVIDVTMADSITTWLLTAEAIAADGRIGTTQAEVKVFQDFFVDLDLPPVMTQHDELAVPVAVYNYLPTPERITLTLEDGPWFRRLGEATATPTQSIDLAPGQVGVVHFRIAALGVGRKKLTVHARGRSAKDATSRSVEVFPDGVAGEVSFQDRLAPGSARHRLEIPANAIADASMAQLKVYPGMATHVIEGLDSMLHMPGGCFEQTSSTTYPNALILDYLRRSKKATPELEKKATGYLALGYQKLLSFEVRGGGFSWFGQAPANKILTAYGLEEFSDMARVHPVDRKVIERTRLWLEARQRSDGSFAPDTQFINEGATNHFNTDVTRITAYIALALKRAGGTSAVARAQAYVRRHLDREVDAYTLALAAELLADSHNQGDAAQLDVLLDRLWNERKDDGKTTSFTARSKTPTYGDGRSGTVETTARAASSMLAGARPPRARVERAIGYLLGAKDSWGSWHSTQATIRSLKALLDYQAQKRGEGRGKVTITVGGEPVATLAIDGANDALQVLDLGKIAAHGGAHDVALRYDGTGEIAYQLTARYYQPRLAPAAAPGLTAELAVETRLEHAELAVGGRITEEVRVTSREAVDMPIVTAGLPPGFDVDGDALDALVKSRVVEKVQRTPREVIFYLRALEAGRPLTLPLHLTARFPARVLVPPPTVYEYYRPERKAAGEPVLVTVKG
ncbi:MAG: hypothetical protein EXR72_19670 [Myxococcales bacterium]|nr:hypothetical protein [Myxococcales bacterium]